MIQTFKCLITKMSNEVLEILIYNEAYTPIFYEREKHFN